MEIATTETPMRSISANSTKESIIPESQTDLTAIEKQILLEPKNVQPKMISLMSPEAQKDQMYFQAVESVPSFHQKQMDLSQTTQNTNSDIDLNSSQTQSPIESLTPSLSILEKVPHPKLLLANQSMTKQSQEAYQFLVNRMMTLTPSQQIHPKSLIVLSKNTNQREHPNLIFKISHEDPHKLKSPLLVKEV